jgi:hypothetical protein
MEGLAPTLSTLANLSSALPTLGVLDHILRTLATDLHERGGLDLSECFIDGPLGVAKKGGAGWDRPSGAKGRRSWQLQTALVFLSPSTLQVLRRMKSPLWHQRSPRVRSLLDLPV